MQLLGLSVDRSDAQTCNPSKEQTGSGCEEVPGRQLVALQEVESEPSSIWRVPSAELALCWRKLPFENPSNICCLNTIVNMIGWVLLHSSHSLRSWGWIGKLCISVLGHRPRLLLDNDVMRMFRCHANVSGSLA